jgi:hypothetical protein
LLLALDASEERRRRRKCDTTPDALGLSLKHQLLIRAVEADPNPDEFARSEDLRESAAGGGPRPAP